MGLTDAGFQCIKAYDNWPAAVDTFGRNICETVDEFDLRFHPSIPHCDVIAGGPPCQGFSSAGRRHCADERNSFVGRFAELVANHLPTVFIFENVEGFSRPAAVDCYGFVAPAHSCWLLHPSSENKRRQFWDTTTRKRVIAIGGLGFDPGFPQWTHHASGAPGSNMVAKGLPQTPSLNEAISNMPRATIKPPGHLSDHWYRPFNDEDLERVTLLRQGDRMRDLPERLWHTSYKRRAFRRVMDGTPVEKRGGAPAALRRLVGDEPSKAITSGTLRDFVHPCYNRPLTLREAARLQTYPDWFEFEGSPTDRMQMIANSVPIGFATRIGESVINNLRLPKIVRNTDGKLISFVPTFAKGMSPALEETCNIVRNEFGGTLWPAHQNPF